jgi:hypothetical protein
MTLTPGVTSTRSDAPEPEHTPQASAARHVEDPATSGEHRDATDDATITQRRLHLHGRLSDLQSEYDNANHAIAAAREGSGPCLALGALLARCDSCAADLEAVRAELASLTTERAR